MIKKLGPYELNQIYCGECSRMLSALPDGCIDLTVTSPPYDSLRLYNGYTFDFEPIARELYRVTKPGGVVVWVVGDETKDGSETFTSLRQALYFRDVCGFKAHDTMIYETDKPPMNDKRYQACFEYMFVFSKGAPKTFNPIRIIASTKGRKRENAITYRQSNGELKKQWRQGFYPTETIKTAIWYYPTGRLPDITRKLKRLNPATFPDSLARDHILSWSNPGDIVLDPMVGSGTTAKMAYQLHRHYLGFDISQEYVDLARRRVAMADMPLPLVENDPMESPEQLAFEIINES